MKQLLYLFCFLLATSTLSAKDKKTSEPLRYDIEPQGVSASGMTLIKLSLYVSDPEEATDDLLKKAAVHGIIFRGVNSSDATGYGKQAPLASSPAAAQQYGDYFGVFFADGGEYLGYAQIVDATTQTVKTGKKEYRVSVVVNVSTDRLRSTLRSAGVIKGMTDGF